MPPLLPAEPEYEGGGGDDVGPHVDETIMLAIMRDFMIPEYHC